MATRITHSMTVSCMCRRVRQTGRTQLSFAGTTSTCSPREVSRPAGSLSPGSIAGQPHEFNVI